MCSFGGVCGFIFPQNSKSEQISYFFLRILQLKFAYHLKQTSCFTDFFHLKFGRQTGICGRGFAGQAAEGQAARLLFFERYVIIRLLRLEKKDFEKAESSWLCSVIITLRCNEKQRFRRPGEYGNRTGFRIFLKITAKRNFLDFILL